MTKKIANNTLESEEARENFHRYVSLLLWIAEEVETDPELAKRIEVLTKKDPASRLGNEHISEPPTFV